MDMPPVITFLSDFGWDSGYPAACELVIVHQNPVARVVHLTHSIPAGDVKRGAHMLRLLVAHAPVAVHLAIVDPGVGSRRRALCLECGRGDCLVGPDNGLLLPAAVGLGGIDTAWDLSAPRIRSRAGLEGPLSRTFHGRDIFAPAAALLLAGEPPAALGRPLDPATLTPPFVEEPVVEPSRVITSVSEIDTFGNVQLQLGWPELQKWLGGLPAVQMPTMEILLAAQVHGKAGGGVGTRGGPRTHRLTMVSTYTDLRSGQLGLLADSWGLAAIAQRDGRAADTLGVDLHDTVTLLPAEPKPADP